MGSKISRGGHRNSTLKEIASAASVDISTVSRAINDSPLITRETKEMIWAIADRMDYIPNSMAQGLASRRSHTLGIILPRIFFLQGPFFSEVLSGIEKVSVENGYNIMIASSSGKNKDKHFPFNLTRARKIDGMLIINENRKIGNLTELKKEGVPFVLVNRYLEDPDAPCVAANDVHGGRIATEHLLKLGHRRIGAITGSIHLAATQGRLRGYREALENAGISFDPALVQEGLFEQGIESGVNCAAQLLALPNRPTAIFALSDELAMGVMQAAKTQGLVIPRDLALIGYDNVAYSGHLNPPLTTVSQSPRTIGATSCRMLIDLLDGTPLQQPNIRVSVRLIVRESSGHGLVQRSPAE